MKVVSFGRNQDFESTGFLTIKVRAKDIPYAKLERLWVEHGFPANRMAFEGLAGIHQSGYGFNEPVLYRFTVRYYEEDRFARQFLAAMQRLEESLTFEEINAPKGESFIAALQPWM